MNFGFFFFSLLYLLFVRFKFCYDTYRNFGWSRLVFIFSQRWSNPSVFLSSGKLLRRQRIPLPEEQQQCAGQILQHERFYGVEHLSLGQVLQIYGKRVKLVRADVFTSEFLKSCGLNVGRADPVEFDSLMAPDPRIVEVRDDIVLLLSFHAWSIGYWNHKL